MTSCRTVRKGNWQQPDAAGDHQGEVSAISVTVSNEKKSRHSHAHFSLAKRMC